MEKGEVKEMECVGAYKRFLFHKHNDAVSNRVSLLSGGDSGLV